MKNDELARLSVYIRSWCPGDPQQLELIYRGSRDGFRAAAFHAKCTEKNPSTITLVKVDHGGPNGTSDGSTSSSVVGSFSSVSWTRINGAQGYYQSQGYTHYYYAKESPDAFIFMPEDGSTQGEQNLNPLRGPCLEVPKLTLLYDVVTTWDLILAVVGTEWSSILSTEVHCYIWGIKAPPTPPCGTWARKTSPRSRSTAYTLEHQ